MSIKKKKKKKGKGWKKNLSSAGELKRFEGFGGGGILHP